LKNASERRWREDGRCTYERKKRRPVAIEKGRSERTFKEESTEDHETAVSADQRNGAKKKEKEAREDRPPLRGKE